jgi:beta-lactamase class A
MLVQIVRAAWLKSLEPPFLSLLAFLLLCGACDDTPAQDEDPLAQSIHQILTEYPEVTVGLSVRDLDTGLTFDLNPDLLFHAASTMKVPVMIEVFRRDHLGMMSLDDAVTVHNEFRSIVDGSLYSLDIGEDSDPTVHDSIGAEVRVGWLVERMITWSSNLATNILIDLVGADSVQATIERLGARTMRVHRGVEDIKAYRQGLNNTATAADLSTLLAALARGKAVSPEADASMLTILTEQEFNDMIPAGLPDGTSVAHKTGWITGIDHDAAIVYQQHRGPYVLIILTEGIDDKKRSAELGARLAGVVHRFAVKGG